MHYNTAQEHILLPEYGRTIQRLVQQAVELPTKEERTRCAYGIVDIMGNLFPYLRDSEDYKHKLWDHLAIMSNFELDIDYPCEPLKKEKLYSKPERVNYPVSFIEERHYGNSIMLMIDKIVMVENPDERSAMIQLVVNHMKKCYVLWNNSSVDDEKIIDDMCYLSRGMIRPEEITFKLTDSRNMFEQKKKKFVNQNNKNNNNRNFQPRNGQKQINRNQR